jgi:hypothetical protein
VPLPQLVTSIVRWIRSGHPDGLPTHAYIPLLAILPICPPEPDVKIVPASNQVDHRAPWNGGFQPV